MLLKYEVKINVYYSALTILHTIPHRLSKNHGRLNLHCAETRANLELSDFCFSAILNQNRLAFPSSEIAAVARAHFFSVRCSWLTAIHPSGSHNPKLQAARFRDVRTYYMHT